MGVLAVEDVGPGKVAVVEVDGKQLAVCRTAEPCGDGEFFVIADVCTHDGGALDQGELIGCEIECPRHGARFDVTTGKVKRLPAVRPVKTYPVRVVDGRVEVEVT
ncbi:MAG: non-heme iron oxygenase ferredoxin subunit [Dehalococcoidia bacterium]